MVRNLIKRGRKLVMTPSSTILSAATVVMVMSLASRVLGLVRQSVLSHYFLTDQLSLFFAAFRLPDLIFEVLVFGTFASAFIPVFTKALEKGNGRAWRIASTVVNIGLLVFGVLAILVGLFAGTIYKVITPGFEAEGVMQIAKIARILFMAQGFFVVSYVLTGVLESLRHFLIPALAPVFYNVGIILGTLFLAPKIGLLGPAWGVVGGAALHFAVQFPLARKLGFRFKLRIDVTEDVKKIGKLAAPRVVDVSFQQIGKTVELLMASLLSAGSYTYLTFANTLQLVPVSLFGTSIAKAALPTLARKDGDLKEFKKILLSTLNQMMFFVLPVVALLIVLRIPIVRLVYGRRGFGWEDTIQTGMVLTAFAVGVPFQTIVALTARAYYALHDTKTPVIASIVSIVVMIALYILFVTTFSLPAWGLALAFSISAMIHGVTLFFLLMKRLGTRKLMGELSSIVKSLLGTVGAGAVMFFLLKVFDKSVWNKNLSFVDKWGLTYGISFESFVLDTRYTINLVVLTGMVVLVGIFFYLSIMAVLRSKELAVFIRMIQVRKFRAPRREPEVLSPSISEVSD